VLFRQVQRSRSPATIRRTIEVGSFAICLACLIAKQLNVPNNYIVGLASYESGWSDDHNAKLNNLWGLTKGGGNNLSFPSIQAGNQSFITTAGPFIQNAQTIPTFFSGLKKKATTR
jgi:hypothetical protein